MGNPFFSTSIRAKAPLVSSLAYVPVLLLVAASTVVTPVSARAVDLDRAVAFDIEPQPIGSALIEFSRQANIQVVIAPEIAGTAAEFLALHGTVPARVALDMLLRNTGLKYDTVGKSVSVTRVGDSMESSSRVAAGSVTPSDGGVADPEAGADRQGLQPSGPNQTTDTERRSESETERGPANNKHQSGAMEEVIVTAQKRTQRVEDVPTSLAVLSGDKLQEEGVAQLSDYAKQVPGLTLIGGGGAGLGQVVLRGISSGGSSHSLVGVYLDEVPFTPSSANSDAASSFLFDPDLADIERIEVLNGPQSTLYGASSMGGVLKFVTKQPDLTDFAGSVRIDGSQVDGGGTGYGVRGSVNVPIVADTIGLRASAFYRDDPGFVNNDFKGEKNVNNDSVKGGRLSLRVKFTDDLETTLSGLVQNIDNFGANLVYLNPETLRPVLGSLAYSSPFNLSSSVANRSISDTTMLNLHFATLSNVASYASVIGSGVADVSSFAPFVGLPPGSFLNDFLRFESKRYSDELRLVSSPGRVEWLLGGFYTHESDPDYVALRPTDSVGVIFPPSSPYYNVLTYSNTSLFKEKAIFGDLTYHLTNQIEGTVGMRYSSDIQSLNGIGTGPLEGPPGGVTFLGNSSESAKTYLGTVTYKPTAQMSVYLRAASAYRPGGPNILPASVIAAGALPTFGPDKLWNYEAGIKGSIWDRRINYSAAVYHMDWSDIQLNVIYNGFGVVANASSAKSDGIEAALQLVPIDGLTVSLNGAYTNAKLTSDIAAPISAVSGDRLPYSQKFAAAAVFDYRFTAFNRVVPHAGLTFAYHGSENTAFTTAGGSTTLPSYQTLDLRAGVDWLRYSVIARIDNVANKYALAVAGPTTATGAPFGGGVIKPRTFGITLMAKL